MAPNSVRYFQKVLYRELESRDPLVRFRNTLNRYTKSKMSVLDLGAGAGEESPYALKGKVSRLVGIDRDPRVGENQLLDTGVVGEGGNLPFKSDSFDLVFSIYVLEHITSPPLLVSELGRVLKPGGYFLALTPSRFHYVSLIAACTPIAFHKWLNKKRGRREEDTFPTRYRLNSRRQLQTHFVRQGFQLVEFDSFEVQPNYLMFSGLSFLAGAVYERVVNYMESLSSLRVNFISALKNTKVL